MNHSTLWVTGMFRKNAQGFSLVELMVGIAVALLTTLVIMQSYQAFEGQKRTTGSSTESLVSGQYVLFSINQGAANAGYGFQFQPYGIGCALQNYPFTVTNAIVPTAPVGIDTARMMPALIVDGGSQPDALRITYGDSALATAQPGVMDVVGLSLTTTNTALRYGIRRGDVVLIQDEAGRCQLAQVTNTPVANPMNLVSMAVGAGSCEFATCTGSSFNPNTPMTPQPAVSDAWISALGSLSFQTFRVVGSNMEQHTAIVGNRYNSANTLITTPPNIVDTTGTGAANIVAGDVVDFQIEYGLDTVADVTPVSQVDTWTSATGNFAAAAMTTARARQIRAIRYAVVIRTPLPERPQNGTCNTTTTTMEPSAAKTISWPLASAMGMTVNLERGATVDTWRCYRYQVFQDMIPLRNLIWNVVDMENASAPTT